MNWLEHLFPKLRDTGYRVIAPSDPVYNCIAWAIGGTDAWWWPSADQSQADWPEDVPREETLNAIQAAFEARGFRVCDTDVFEEGFEKVALFAMPAGTPTHVALQSNEIAWTSKLGQLECIEHALHDLEGAEYGSVAIVMKRPLE